MSVNIKLNNKKRLKINEVKKIKRTKVLKERKEKEQLNEFIGGFLAGGLLGKVLSIFTSLFGGSLKFLLRSVGLMDKVDGWNGLKSALKFFGKSEEEIRRLKQAGILTPEQADKFSNEIQNIINTFTTKVEKVEADLRVGTPGPSNLELFNEVERMSKQLYSRIEAELKVTGKDPRAIKPLFKFKDKVKDLLNGLDLVRIAAAQKALGDRREEIKAAMSAARKINVTDQEVDALILATSKKLKSTQSFVNKAKLMTPGKSMVEKENN